MYYGYCHRTQQYRMMDLPDFVSNTQQGIANLVSNNTAPYQNLMNQGGAATAPAATGTAPMPWHRHHHGDCGCGGEHGGHHHRDCGCNDRHCECCVCDADVLIHARCGELRRIPLTFENDTRRDKPITLELGKFLSKSGKDLGWAAQLSETQLTLHPCDEQTVSLIVGIRCKSDDPAPPTNSQTPGTANDAPGSTPANAAGGNAPPANASANASTANASTANASTTGARVADTTSILGALESRFGDVDRCEVGYATIRAEGCLTRPIVVAVAVLPEDCDAFRHPCGCSCCC
jgi:hypothetical protein